MNFLGMGPMELALIAALALVVIGPSKLPDLARQVGRLMGELRRMSTDVHAEFKRSLAVDEDSPRTPVVRPSPPPPPRRDADDDLRPPY